MNIEELLARWNDLDKPHKEFIYRAYKSNGVKYRCEPHFTETDEIIGYDVDNGEPCYNSIALWHLAEESGFVECIGSYKWVATEDFRRLYQYFLFGE